MKRSSKSSRLLRKLDWLKLYKSRSSLSLPASTASWKTWSYSALTPTSMSPSRLWAAYAKSSVKFSPTTESENMMELKAMKRTKKRRRTPKTPLIRRKVKRKMTKRRRKKTRKLPIRRSWGLRPLSCVTKSSACYRATKTGCRSWKYSPTSSLTGWLRKLLRLAKLLS